MSKLWRQNSWIGRELFATSYITNLRAPLIRRWTMSVFVTRLTKCRMWTFQEQFLVQIFWLVPNAQGLFESMPLYVFCNIDLPSPMTKKHSRWQFIFWSVCADKSGFWWGFRWLFEIAYYYIMIIRNYRNYKDYFSSLYGRPMKLSEKRFQLALIYAFF